MRNTMFVLALSLGASAVPLASAQEPGSDLATSPPPESASSASDENTSTTPSASPEASSSEEAPSAPQTSAATQAEAPPPPPVEEPSSAGTSALQTLQSMVQIHGYGNYAAGVTSDNVYLAGATKGEFRSAEFSLRQIAMPLEGLRIAAAQRFEVGNAHDGDNVLAELEFAFADYAFTDHVSVQAGMFQTPVGLYTALWDVGTLRPFGHLPQSVYGPNGMLARATTGLALDLHTDTESGYSVAFTVFGGGMNINRRGPGGVNADTLALGRDHSAEPVEPLLGGRLVVSNPMSGLEVGVAGYAGDSGGSSFGHWAANGYVSYVSDTFEWRNEALVHGDDDEGGDKPMYGGYSEAAYRLRYGLQAALRGEGYYQGVDDSVPRWLSRHYALVAGLNHWISPDLVGKLSYHYIIGNRYAAPVPSDVEDMEEVSRVAAQVAAGDVEKTTHYGEFAVSFSF